VRRGDRKFEPNEELLTLDNGLVNETYQEFHGPVYSSDLQKSSPDTGKLDGELTFTVKNYPRRNYLSPSDCPITMSEVVAEPGEFTKTSPPVSPLGWNFPTLVRELIRKRPVPRKPKPVPAATNNGGPPPGTNHKRVTNKALHRLPASKAAAPKAASHR
jgi:hypothetical protein